MKRWLVILFLILILFCGTAQAISEEGYNWIPEQDSYLLVRVVNGEPSIIVINFLDPTSWINFAKKEYNLRGDQLGGSTLRRTYKNRETGEIIKITYQIDIPYQPDGSINLDSLGHEIAHVLDFEWHE